MNNILILFNPYYQKGVIEEHLKILQDQNSVAFGKVRSKLKNMQNPSQSELEEIYKNTTEANFLQVFLSDYANLYVAKVIKVSQEVEKNLIPSYYQEKGLEVEHYFIISDLRELVRENFSLVRDEYLGNFKVPFFGGYSYAIYGNSYVYPLIITPKEPINFFESDTKHFLDIYKSEEYLALQAVFKDYIFGEYFYALHPDSIANLISAELEFKANEKNPLYDFTSVLVKLSKVLEHELHRFAKFMLHIACEQNPSLMNFEYRVQQRPFRLEQFFTHHANVSTMIYLLLHEKIVRFFDTQSVSFIKNRLAVQIRKLQNIRNESIHARTPSLEEVKIYRDNILGIDTQSLLKLMLAHKASLKR